MDQWRFHTIILTVPGKGLCGSTEFEEVLRKSSFSSVEEIYEGLLQDRAWVAPGEKTRSVATLSGASILAVQLTERSIKPRLKFIDKNGYKFDRPVSDLTLWDHCSSLVKKQGNNKATVEHELLTAWQNATSLYLRLGLARPWKPEDNGKEKCWLQITGVYTFPDYLNGKCFADL